MLKKRKGNKIHKSKGKDAFFKPNLKFPKSVQTGRKENKEASNDFHTNLQASKSSGKKLPEETKHLMSKALGDNYDNVKIHTNKSAHKMSQRIQAKAFTLGNDIYFNQGQYQPNTSEGKKLLAHELTHVKQQKVNNTNRIQRKLSVDKAKPTDINEPASQLSQDDFEKRVIKQSDALVQGLCSKFHVDNQGEVKPKSTSFCKDREAVTQEDQELGCCCLCIMTDPNRNPWTLTISEFKGPRTDPNEGVRNIRVHPIESVFKFHNWTVPEDDGSEALVRIDPIMVFGHELCGHAALFELGANEKQVDPGRVSNNEHDNAVRIQNALENERDTVADVRDRAEANQGTHRGESTVNVTISDFKFNQSNLITLPDHQKETLIKVARFALENDMWIDILGHSDTVGSEAAKQKVSDNRAATAKRFLISVGLSAKFSKHGLKNVDRYTRVEGRSDFDKFPGSQEGVQDPKLRRVEIIMSSRPAGAQNPVPGTPLAKDDKVDIGPDNPTRVNQLKNSDDPCIKKLINIAWP